MPKRRADPVTQENGDETHPAFGLISAHRISATPGEVLFQSDLRHSEYIRIDVHEATRKRTLKQDRVHPEELVCEVSMSISQFSLFVASGGTTGVPCTIEWTGTGANEPGDRPGLNPAPRLALTHEEVRAAAAKAYGDIQEAFETYKATLDDSGKGSAAARRAALRDLQAIIANAAPNVAYAAKALDEHAEAVVEKSRADIEAMATLTAGRLGIPASEVPEIEAAQ
jgi:hypothetical protein